MDRLRHFIYALALIICFVYVNPASAESEKYRELFRACDEGQQKFISAIDRKERELTLLRAELQEQLRMKIEEIDRLKTRLSAVQGIVDAYSSSPVEKEKRIERLDLELRSGRAEIESLKNRLESAEKTIAGYKRDGKRPDLPERDGEAGRLRMELQEKNVELKILADLVDEMQETSDKLWSSEEEIKRLNEELEDRTSEIEDLELEKQNFVMELHRLDATVKNQEAEIARLNLELAKRDAKPETKPETKAVPKTEPKVEAPKKDDVKEAPKAKKTKAKKKAVRK